MKAENQGVKIEKEGETPDNSISEIEQLETITPDEGTTNEGLSSGDEEMKVKKEEVQAELQPEVENEATIEGLAKKFNVSPEKLQAFINIKEGSELAETTIDERGPLGGPFGLTEKSIRSIRQYLKLV